MAADDADHAATSPGAPGTDEAALAAVEGVPTRLYVGGRWTDGSGSTENALVVDGSLTKISDELTWEFSSADWMRPWHIHGGPVDVTFHPEHVREASINLVVLGSATHQCFGTWTGRVGDVTVNELSFARQGDESVAFRVTMPITSSGFSFDYVCDFVVVRIGRAQVVTTAFSLGGTVDAEELNNYVSLGVGRLQDAL